MWMLLNLLMKGTQRFLWWLSGKESVCNAGDEGLIPGSQRCPREGKNNPFQCFWPHVLDFTLRSRVNHPGLNTPAFLILA